MQSSSDIGDGDAEVSIAETAGSVRRVSWEAAFCAEAWDENDAVARHAKSMVMIEIRTKIAPYESSGLRRLRRRRRIGEIEKEFGCRYGNQRIKKEVSRSLGIYPKPPNVGLNHQIMSEVIFPVKPLSRFSKSPTTEREKRPLSGITAVSQKKAGPCS
jgi:hypothetical protein